MKRKTLLLPFFIALFVFVPHAKADTLVSATVSDPTVSPTSCSALYSSIIALGDANHIAAFDFSKTLGTLTSPGNHGVTSSSAFCAQFPFNLNTGTGKPNSPVSGDTWYMQFHYYNGSYHYASLYIELHYISGVWSGSVVDTSTRIESVTPAGGSTVATSTAFTFGVSGYISSADLQTGTKIRITGSDNAYNQISSVYTAVTPQYNFVWTATSSGAFSLSTTTIVTNQGNVNIRTTIERPSYSLFGFTIPYFTTTLVATSTTFTVVATTSLDAVVQQFSDAYDAVYSSGTTISDSCTIVGFDFVACLTGLLVPNTQGLASVFTSLRDGIFTIFPFGYITRTGVILADTSTTTLPSLEIEVPSGYPGAGAVFNLTPWDDLLGSSSPLSVATDTLHAVGGTASGKTLREIVEPGWNIIVYAIFGMIVIFQLLGLNHLHRTHNHVT